MVLALSTKYFRTSYFQNCTFSEWTNQFLHIIGLENAKLDIFVPTLIFVILRLLISIPLFVDRRTVARKDRLGFFIVTHSAATFKSDIIQGE